MIYLDDTLWFPEHDVSDPEGLLAIGGDLSVARLLLAYRNGIFPWYEEGQPILWWSPNPRMVLFPENFKISKSFRQTLRKDEFSITYNTAFDRVLQGCAGIERPGQEGTWITTSMQQAYLKLYQLGHVLSVEVWRNNELVGGLYGVDLPEKRVFCGESMFSRYSNASKVALSYLVARLSSDNYHLIDCQVYTEHLDSLGAVEISRGEFLTYLT